LRYAKECDIEGERTDLPHSGANRAASVKWIGAAFSCPVLFRCSLSRAHAANQAGKRTAQCLDKQHKTGAHKPRRQTDSLLDRPNGKAYEQAHDNAKRQKVYNQKQVNEFISPAMLLIIFEKRGGLLFYL